MADIGEISPLHGLCGTQITHECQPVVDDKSISTHTRTRRGAKKGSRRSFPTRPAVEGRGEQDLPKCSKCRQEIPRSPQDSPRCTLSREATGDSPQASSITVGHIPIQRRCGKKTICPFLISHGRGCPPGGGSGWIYFVRASCEAIIGTYRTLSFKACCYYFLSRLRRGDFRYCPKMLLIAISWLFAPAAT